MEIVVADHFLKASKKTVILRSFQSHKLTNAVQVEQKESYLLKLGEIFFALHIMESFTAPKKRIRDSGTHRNIDRKHSGFSFSAPLELLKTTYRLLYSH